MKLVVKNFGPIKSATVDLKPLTVFAGHSNTGKSYLATLVYTVAKVWAGNRKIEKDFSKVLIEILMGFLSAQRDNIIPLMRDGVPHPEIFSDPLLKKQMGIAVPKMMEYMRTKWEKEARRCFGKEWDESLRQNGTNATSIALHGEHFVLDLVSSANDKLPQTSIVLEQLKSLINSTERKTKTSSDAKEEIAEDLLTFCQRSAEAMSNILRADSHVRHEGILGYVHYLPAIRGGIMLSHHMLVAQLIKNSSKNEADTAPFSGVAADFLQRLTNISMIETLGAVVRFIFGDAEKKQGRKNEKPKIVDIAKQLQKNVLHGKVHLNESETNYPNFRYQFQDAGNKSREMSLMQSSSSVAETAPIALFIKYYLQPGSFFIVEEPEAHLHPQAQRQIAAVLAQLANAGVRVLITTHSDVILEQLSNFMNAANSRADALGKVELQPESVATYSFVGKKSGTRVREIQSHPTMGIVPADHSDITSEIYNEAVSIADASESADAQADD